MRCRAVPGAVLGAALGAVLVVLTGCTATSTGAAASAPTASQSTGAPAAAVPADSSDADSPDPSAPVAAEVLVDTVQGIRDALASAQPGAVIRVADGEYQFKPRLVASASGTAARPITLVGTRNAVLRTKNASGDTGLNVTGDHWRVEGLTVAHASKGIVLDGAVGTVLDGVEVFDIGDEGVHFRACSSDGVLQNSFVHDTGRNSTQYGEGVYVGSANSIWSKYECTDPQERQTRGDNTERTLIEDNVFEDVTAEGASLEAPGASPQPPAAGRHCRSNRNSSPTDPSRFITVHPADASRCEAPQATVSTSGATLKLSRNTLSGSNRDFTSRKRRMVFPGKASSSRSGRRSVSKLV